MKHYKSLLKHRERRKLEEMTEKNVPASDNNSPKYLGRLFRNLGNPIYIYV